METRYQRVAREQKERQAARQKALAKSQNAKYAAIRKHNRWEKAGRKERAVLERLMESAQ